MEIKAIYQKICDIAEGSFGVQFLSSQDSDNHKNFIALIEKQISLQPEILQNRLRSEFFGYGPLEDLLLDASVTEILVNDSSTIWFERDGFLCPYHDAFFSHNSFENILERLSTVSGKHLSLNHPFLEGHFDQGRISIVEKSVTQKSSLLSIRKHPPNPWTLEKLVSQGWCDAESKSNLEKIIGSESNFLIIGETGSGKTSVANACLQKIRSNERAIIIEDSSELHTPNNVSIKLLTREDPFQQLAAIDQQELLKRSLRLRPDRLIMGEIRNKEAKDFLMLLATGHKGCFATLHAKKPQEALIRLEMLIQLGAPQWSLSAIRRLIFLSLQFVIVTRRTPNGARTLFGIYKLSSLEDSGITLDSAASCDFESISSDCV